MLTDLYRVNASGKLNFRRRSPKTRPEAGDEFFYLQLVFLMKLFVLFNGWMKVNKCNQGNFLC